jgi:hypothetical protein
MFFQEIIPVCGENHMNRINAICERNASSYIPKVGSSEIIVFRRLKRKKVTLQMIILFVIYTVLIQDQVFPYRIYTKHLDIRKKYRINKLLCYESVVLLQRVGQ